MTPTTAVFYAVAVIVLLILLQMMARPLEMLLRLLGNSIAGGVALWALNMVGEFAHFHLALNPVSAAIVGIMGLPGVLALGIMRTILG